MKTATIVVSGVQLNYSAGDAGNASKKCAQPAAGDEIVRIGFLLEALLQRAWTAIT
jgi:hypothetical protein